MSHVLKSVTFLIQFRRIPYTVAYRHHHGACAALLDPSSAEPLVWPSPLKFISELNQEAKALLEHALMEANREREKTILKGSVYSLPSPSASDSGVDDDISEVILNNDSDLIKYLLKILIKTSIMNRIRTEISILAVMSGFQKVFDSLRLSLCRQVRQIFAAYVLIKYARSRYKIVGTGCVHSALLLCVATISPNQQPLALLYQFAPSAGAALLDWSWLS